MRKGILEIKRYKREAKGACNFCELIVDGEAVMIDGKEFTVIEVVEVKGDKQTIRFCNGCFHEVQVWNTSNKRNMVE